MAKGTHGFVVLVVGIPCSTKRTRPLAAKGATSPSLSKMPTCPSANAFSSAVRRATTTHTNATATATFNLSSHGPTGGLRSASVPPHVRRDCATRDHLRLQGHYLRHHIGDGDERGFGGQARSISSRNSRSCTAQRTRLGSAHGGDLWRFSLPLRGQRTRATHSGRIARRTGRVRVILLRGREKLLFVPLLFLLPERPPGAQ